MFCGQPFADCDYRRGLQSWRMQTALSPDHMTSHERIVEIASILLLGIQRLHEKQAGIRRKEKGLTRLPAQPKHSCGHAKNN